MKIVYIIFFSFLLPVLANARSVKSPQTVSFSNITSMLEIYKNQHGNNLPTSWREFIDSGFLSGGVLDNARQFLDIENRYIFVDLKQMRFGHRTERVVIMARQAGGEGDNNNAEEPEKRKGRWLIVETSDGSIQTRKFPEVMLKLWFEEAGLNLADFTSASPPPPTIKPPFIGPYTNSIPLGGPDNPVITSMRAVKNLFSPERKLKSPHAGDKLDSTQAVSWLTWASVGIAAIAVFLLAWFIRKMPLSKSSSKT